MMVKYVITNVFPYQLFTLYIVNSSSNTVKIIKY